LDQPLLALAEHWIRIDEHARARDVLVDLLRRAEDVGDENARPWLLCLLAGVERDLGDPVTGLALAREAREAADQSGMPLFAKISLALESMALVQLGRPEQALQVAHAALDGPRNGIAGLMAPTALGHLALSLGTPAETVAHLEAGTTFVRREGIVEPGAARFVIDQIEALTELGRSYEAVELLEWYEGNAQRLERVSALANCARCRGRLAAQAGDLDGAAATFEEALEWHTQVELPLDRGRTLLAFGATQRRMKRRREARATLEEALAVFEGMGMALWAERSRAELKRISGRAATPGALTPAEERVAALVADGKTNKEVAAALFLSERTVEGHLAHIFGKLGVRKRREIASVLALTQTQVTAPSDTGDSPVSAESPSP
jgi:DNA-binding CsgD family transcriptional regulator